jgi:histidinol-phosphate aminotransferase
VPLGPGFAYDLDALAGAVSEKTKLVFLANPNNPTGVYAGRAAFERLVKTLPAEVLLVVDEAYIEFARASDFPDTLPLLAERERMITLRTFSKIHGLAGLRVGYAVGRPHVVEYLNRTRLPFNVSSVAQAAARAALEDTAHVQRTQALMAEELPKLERAISALGLGVTPSQANFVLVDLGRPARPLYDALLHKGVIARPLGNYGLPNHLRITVGTPAENERLLRALAEVL